MSGHFERRIISRTAFTVESNHFNHVANVVSRDFTVSDPIKLTRNLRANLRYVYPTSDAATARFSLGIPF